MTATTKDTQNHERIAAFFDFDKTIIGVDSAGKEATTILAKHYLDRWLVVLGLVLCTLVEPLVERNWLSTELLNWIYYFCCYRGMSVATLQQHAQDLYRASIRSSIYPEILDLLQKHQQQGHLVVILSATSPHLLEPFLKEYQVEVSRCTQIHTKLVGKEPHYTGVIQGKVCCQQTKADHMQQLATEYGLNLDASYAYSDHHHDIPLLESVGHAHAVNPTPLLEQVAKKRDWTILRPTMNSIPIT